MKNEFRVGELAQKAGVTKRTIHYYISKGLIPPSRGSGLASTYDDEHLYRILYVKKLQEKFLPLERIRDIVTGLNMEEIKARLDESDDMSVHGDVIFESACDYQVTLGKEYVRLELGKGFELHYPRELQDKYMDAIINIKNYARRLIEEK